MTRRDLVHKGLIGGVTLFIIPQVLTSCSKEDEPDPPGNPGGSNTIVIDLNNTANAALKETGGSIVTRNVLVMNLGGGSFSALTSVCTHQGCEVGYDHLTTTVRCPCHQSAFTTTGSVVNGPATSPLRSYTITKEGDILTIKL